MTKLNEIAVCIYIGIHISDIQILHFDFQNALITSRYTMFRPRTHTVR